MTDVIRAVGFDLGGVLATYTMPQQLRFMADSVGVSTDDFVAAFTIQRQKLETGKLDEGIFWDDVAASLKTTMSGAQLREYWNSWYGEHNIISEKMLKLVDDLQAAGYGVGLLSNIDPDHAETNRSRGIFGHFEVNVLSTELQYLKPHTEAYEALRKRLKVEYSELVFIDDSPINISAANLLGIHGILFQSYQQTLETLRSLGVKI